MFNNYSIYLKKILNVIIANFVNFICSVLITLFLPKFITVNEYGQWQYFLLLFSYIEFFYLGLPQGIYLRFGGYNLSNLKTLKLYYSLGFNNIDTLTLSTGIVGDTEVKNIFGLDFKINKLSLFAHKKQ